MTWNLSVVPRVGQLLRFMCLLCLCLLAHWTVFCGWSLHTLHAAGNSLYASRYTRNTCYTRRVIRLVCVICRGRIIRKVHIMRGEAYYACRIIRAVLCGESCYARERIIRAKDRIMRGACYARERIIRAYYTLIYYMVCFARIITFITALIISSNSCYTKRYL